MSHIVYDSFYHHYRNYGCQPRRERTMKTASWPVVPATIMLLLGVVQPDLAAEPAVPTQQRLVAAPLGVPTEFPIVWTSRPPEDCPLEQSQQFAGVVFTGPHKVYTNADTFYPSWAADGNLYSPFTDGVVEKVASHSGSGHWNTGHAKIAGDDPMDLKVTPLGLHHASAVPYGGRYPCGSLIHNGIWYYGTYCLAHYKHPWDIMGPFVGFRISRDYGKTWEDTPCTPLEPLFPEAQRMPGPTTPPKAVKSLSADEVQAMGKIKMGSPHVVDFGQNMEHSPDGKMYLTGHGATRPEAACSWISGDQVYLARVTPRAENVNDPSKYEFFAGHDDNGQPIWTSDFAKIEPLLEWNDRLGCVTVTYNAKLRKYLLCVTDGGATGMGKYDTMILEAEQITGPWRLAAFLEEFGQQAYFVNVPSKFIGEDGRSMWLCFADDWVRKHPENPPGTRYGMCLYEVRLLRRDDKIERPSEPPPDPLATNANVAPKAKATASSQYPACPPAGAINGVVGGLPGDFADEWSAVGEHAGAWLRLTWPQPQRIGRVWLFDRPSNLVQITAAELRFSDGATIGVGELPDDARRGLEVSFPARTVTWLEVKITRTKSNHPYIGLSEVAVFAATK